MRSRRVFSEEELQMLVEFYKTNSTNITCEHFNITPDYLFILLKQLGVEKHTAAENRELTSLVRFGVKNAAMSSEKQMKAKQTTEQRHGSSNFRNQQKANETRVKNCGSVEASYKQATEKQRQTNQEKYGCDFYFTSENFQKQAEETNQQKYGVSNFRQSERYEKQYHETCLKKYGVDHYSKTDDYRNKIKQTCNSRYAADSWFGSEQGKKSVINSSQRIYGVDNPMSSEIVQQHLKSSIQKKYGVDNPMQDAEVRSKQAKSSRVSSFELVVSELLVKLQQSFEHHYVIKNDQFIHEFDFAVFENGQLKTLIDCDGLYYHSYLDDINGKSVNPVADEYRMLLVPQNVDFLIVSENDYVSKLTSYFDSTNYEQEIFNWCRSSGFPFPTIKNVESSYNALVKSDCSKFTTASRLGERVINQFHKSIWFAHKHNLLSPYDAWDNDKLLKQCIKNRLIYIGNDLDPSKILYGFNASRIAPKVSVFNPYLAKYLINKYFDSFDTIFDPCSGYSGRLLGTVSLGKRYIGQDINNTTVDESNELIDYFHFDAQVTCCDSLLTTGTYDCLFTCTPYNDKEFWGNDQYNYSCDDWIDKIIKNYNCKQYMFVVDETTNYKNYIVETITNKSHLNTNTEYVIVISS